MHQKPVIMHHPWYATHCRLPVVYYPWYAHDAMAGHTSPQHLFTGHRGGLLCCLFRSQRQVGPARHRRSDPGTARRQELRRSAALSAGMECHGVPLVMA